jgi:tetrahydromethanopterin S-methyltransferase subunit G
MMRNWKTFGLQALLAATLLATPSSVRAEPEKEVTELEKIVKRLEGIETALKEIQKSADIIQAEGLKIKVLKGRIDKLEEQVGSMQPVLDGLKKLMNGKERVSAYPQDSLEDINKRLTEVEKKLSPSTRVAKAAPEVGRILLTNRYTEEITFVLNNRDVYTVLPGKALQVEGYPAGVFTYQIQSPTWGARDRVTSTLPINETVRLTVD